MSRLSKDALVDDAIDLGATGLAVAGVNAEKLSGADLAQVLQARRAGATAAVDANGTKTLGTSAAYAGAPNAAALTAADLSAVSGAN